MAEYVLSYPFRMSNNNRRANVVLSGTDTYKAQQVKAFVRTETTERSIFPNFGIEEPTFNTFDSGQFYDSFSDFYTSDNIEIVEIGLVQSEGALVNVEISFK
jgi:hypothetical protein